MRQQRTFFASLALFTLTFNPSFGSALNGQEVQQPARKGFSVIPAYRRCLPAEVKAIVMGAHLLDGVILAQVTIENRAPKTVTAVKLGWKVYRFGEGVRATIYPCDAPAPEVEVLQSGTTSLIPVGALAPGETCNIGTDPLKFPEPATKTVYVEQPFLTVEEIKSLTEDGTMKTLRGAYMAVMFISEAHYEDGTRWTAENN